jgi:hypothetical protein
MSLIIIDPVVHDLCMLRHAAVTCKLQVGNLQGALDSTSRELAQTKEEARRAETAVTELKGQLAVFTAAKRKV